MKYLITLIVVCTLVSCAPSTPTVGGINPFLVTKIERVKYDDYANLCYYYGKGGIREYIWQGTEECIVLPCGLYQIGDTIKPFKQ